MREHDEELRAQLRPFRVRIRRLLIERMACWGAATAGLLAIALLLVDLLSTHYLTPELLAALVLLGAIAGAGYAAWLPLSDLAVAVTVERRRNLQERLSTAVALPAEAGGSTEFHALVVADALAHLHNVSPRALFPRAFARQHKAALVAWAAASMLFLLPSIPWLQSQQTREEREALRIGITLQAQANALEKMPELQQNPEAHLLIRQMKKLGRRMQARRITKRAALKQMNKLEAQMAQLEKTIDLAQIKHDRAIMQQTADALRKAMKEQTTALREQTEEAKARLKAGTPREQLSEAEKEAMALDEQLSRLAEQLARANAPGVANSLRGVGKALDTMSLTPAERKQLAAALKQMADAMKGMSAQQIAQAMQQAAQQLRQGNRNGQQGAAIALRSLQASSAFRTASGSLQAARQLLLASRHGLAGNQGLCASCNGTAGQSGNGQGNGKQGNGKGAGNQGGNGGGGEGGHGAGGGGAEHPANGDAHTKYDDNQTLDINSTDAAMSVEIPSKEKGAPKLGQSSKVPYYQYYTEYHRTAENAVENEEIPAAERQKVKSYFDALDPNTARK